MTEHAATTSPLGLHSLADYVPLIGEAVVERIRRKVARLHTFNTCHISSTYYGGGVSEMLSPLTLLLNDAGIATGWRILQGTPEFFAVTKAIHNGLQGADPVLTSEKKELYEQVVFENAARVHLSDHDVIVMHDPQPLPLIQYCHARLGCIWQCHVDLTNPHAELWHYLSEFIERFDGTVLSLSEYAQKLRAPQKFIMPAINPFSVKNREMTQAEIDSCLARYRIPTDLPLVVQVSRFDRWKDPQGVIDAFRIARKQVACRLVLVGNRADDDPEAQQLFDAVCGSAGRDVIIVLADDAALVNALQRRAAVVLQKSLREGFGLTVAEAMWKGACVVGGNVGGIRHQISDGVDGFLVDNVSVAAERIVLLLTDAVLRKTIGERAHLTALRRFLMVRLAEDWIDLFGELRASKGGLRARAS